MEFCTSCGYTGDQMKHWGNFPSCTPAWASDQEASFRVPPPAAPTTARTGSGVAAGDTEGASLLIGSQKVARLSKLVLKHKVRLTTIVELKKFMYEHNEQAAMAHALQMGTQDSVAMAARFEPECQACDLYPVAAQVVVE
jgi:hypothetical protein